MLVAAVIAGALDSTLAWILVLTYAVLNLLGTLMVLAEVREQAPGRHPERWELAVRVAFVLQIPLGVVVLAVGGV